MAGPIQRTKQQAQESQDARVFRALAELDAKADDTDAQSIGDIAGVEGSGIFVTPQQATASLKRLEKLGLVMSERDGRRMYWSPTHFGQRLIDGIAHLGGKGVL